MSPNRSAWLVAFIAIDVLAFPVMPVVHLPASSILAGWVLIRHWRDRELRVSPWTVVFTLAAVASMVLSVAIKAPTVIVDNNVLFATVSVVQEDLKRLLFLLYGVVLYIAVKFVASSNASLVSRVVERIVLVALLYAGVTLTVFYLNPPSFATIRSWYFPIQMDAGALATLELSGYFDRFNYILLDPNNAAYFIIMMSLVVLHSRTLLPLFKLYALLILLATPFATGSLGAAVVVLSYMVILLGWHLVCRRSTRVVFSIAMSGALLGVGALLDSVLGLGIWHGLTHSQAQVFQRWEGNSLDGRFENWIALLTSGLPPIVGNGYTLIREGIWFNPHSDHMRFLYGYGVLAYGALIWGVSRLKIFTMRHIFLLPAIAAFSVNSLIDEPRFLYATILLVAVSRFGADERRTNPKPLKLS